MRCLALGFVAAGCSFTDGTPPPKVTTTSKPTPVVVPVVAPAPCPSAARVLAAGMTHERVEIEGAPAIASEDDCLDVVRVDLSGYRLTVGTARATPRARTLPAWLDATGAVAGINAGMFHDDERSVGMLVTAEVENNPDDNERFGGYLAWDPVDPASAPVAVFGRDCAGFDLPAIRTRYRAIDQSYRLLGCDGEALSWKDPKVYSAAAVGVDRDGRLVLLHGRAPHRMGDVARTAARLDLAGAIFVEGGPEASLVARGRDGAVERIGSFETGFVESDGNQRFWDLPNVLLVVPARP